MMLNVTDQSIQLKIEEVIADMKRWKGRCGFTIMINMWMDETDLVECRHGEKRDDDTIILYQSIFYNNKLVRKIQYLDEHQHLIKEETVET